MLTPDTYRARRARLSKDIGSGLVLFLGNDEVGMNYTANVYPFRQDSSFLYFWARGPARPRGRHRRRRRHRDASSATT